MLDTLQQNLDTLQTLGLTLPSPTYIVGATLFNLVGLFAWLRGRKLKLPIYKWLGVALMVYPLFISETWLMFTVGAALCAGLFSYRE